MIAVYVLFNVAVFKALPYEQIISSPTPGADAAEALFGNGGGAFITAGIIISVLGALNGYLMTAARVPQAMGEKQQIPFSRVLSSIHPKFQTPANALIFQSLLAVIYIFSGTFNTLTDLLVFVLWIFLQWVCLVSFCCAKNAARAGALSCTAVSGYPDDRCGRRTLHSGQHDCQ